MIELLYLIWLSYFRWLTKLVHYALIFFFIMNQLNFPLLSKCVDYLLVIFSNSDIFGAMLLKLHFGGFQSIFYVLCRTQSFHSQVKYTVLNVSVINLFKWVEMETLSFYSVVIHLHQYDNCLLDVSSICSERYLPVNFQILLTLFSDILSAKALGYSEYSERACNPERMSWQWRLKLSCPWSCIEGI